MKLNIVSPNNLVFASKLLVLFFLHITSLKAQKPFSIYGQVISEGSEESLPFTNVFLEGTTLGAQSGQTGDFRIDNIPPGKYRLVFTLLGYETKIMDLDLIKEPGRMKIKLSPSAISLDEVKIVGNRNKDWERDYKKFERAFIGLNYNSKDVRILNKEAIDFKSIDNNLIATSKEPILIENKLLGYRIEYFLEDFHSNKKTTAFKGLAHFEEMDNSDEKEKWKENRLKVFKGSINDFLIALSNNQLKDRGFDAFFLRSYNAVTIPKSSLFYDITSNRHYEVIPKEIIQPMSGGLYHMNFPLPMEVVYTRRRLSNFVFPDAPHPYTMLIPRASVDFTKQGQLLDPFSIELRGAMGKNAIAEMLPKNYIPYDKESQKVPSIENLFEAKITYSRDQKIYSHTNRNAFFPGEVVRYKVYVCDAVSNRLIQSPQTLFVQLISEETGKPIFDSILKTTDEGVAWSEIPLPTNLRPGIYFIHIYSNWMRNYSSSPIHEKEIWVESKTPTYVEDKNSKLKLQVGFFPEGGQSIWGSPSTMGIKITPNSGNGYQGEVVDSKNQTVSHFKTSKLGIGHFTLTNSKSNPLHVEILGQSFSLPVPENDAFMLHVDNSSNDLIKVSLSASKSSMGQKVHFLLQSQGRIYAMESLELEKGQAEFSIKKKNLPTGVYQLTAFDQLQTPRAERLIFISSEPSKSTVKMEIMIGESANVLTLKLISEEGLHGEFSISATDASLYNDSPFQENIESYLLLSSELRGQVESPAYYFKDDSLQTLEALDDLLLTQGWRRYRWSDIQKEQNPERDFKEFQPLKFAGTLYSDPSKTKTFKNTRISFVDRRGNLAPISIKTNSEGRFNLPDLDFSGELHLLAKLEGRKNKNAKGFILWEETFPAFQKGIPVRTKSTGRNHLLSAKAHELRGRSDSTISKTYQLEGVTVTAAKKMDFDLDSQGNTLVKLYDIPDHFILMDEKNLGNNIIQIIQGRIPSLVISDGPKGFIYSNHRGNSLMSGSSFSHSEVFDDKSGGKTNDNPPLFLLDGIKVPAPRDQSSLLMSINPKDIDRIDWLDGVHSAVYGIQGGNGVIAIYTKKGNGAAQAVKTETLLQVRLDGFEGYKEYYETQTSMHPDEKGEQLWIPSIKMETGQNKSFSIDSKYDQLLISIQGILENGQPVSTQRVLKLHSP
ncbi:TonB-dependent receptor [Marinilongibacter aquaticus]|uniref:carboxypeptidase-like regulatory domain-containing protein n=1 Tax=Marinilongibacter aquaticus TaxID=2975157 RepID=UPI0021BDAAAC|nr:carboxypeptidase-like regulatory domain-containing protein [Marinilongibacter aquaticus]UBM58690.1 TonB-dependent receptor [Marinilongibacter aquaticus]